METKQETFQIEIETITPVHVGSGRKLMANSEFIIRNVRKSDGQIIRKIGIIDEDKVLKIIGENRLDEWVKVIEKNSDLLKLLKEGKEDISLKDFAVRTIVLNKKETGSENYLKEHILTANRPYIPGSSIKGSIRTALLTNFLNKKESLITNSQFFDRKNRLSDEKIQDQIFGNDPTTDIFRFLHIGDFHFEKNTTVALNILNLNIRRNGVDYDSTKSVLTECIPAGESAIGRIKLSLKEARNARLKANIDPNETLPKTMKQLFGILNSHTSSLFDRELEIWEEYKENDAVQSYIDEINMLKAQIVFEDESSCLIRLGHGAGWRFMTGGWPESESLVSNEIWEKIIDAARPKNHQYKEYIFPKSRRMNENGDLLGFIKLRLK